MKTISLAAVLLASTTVAGMTFAWAQGNAPFLPVDQRATSPASALDNFPHKMIDNGMVSAKVYVPDTFGFYRATRFDHAGMVTHVTYKGQDYGRYWFVKTSPVVRNFSYDADGLVANNNNIAAGPVVSTNPLQRHFICIQLKRKTTYGPRHLAFRSHP